MPTDSNDIEAVWDWCK